LLPNLNHLSCFRLGNLRLMCAYFQNQVGKSEHLYEMLNIPAGSSGRMVKAKPLSEAPRKEPAKSSPTKEKNEDGTARVRTRTKKFTS